MYIAAETNKKTKNQKPSKHCEVTDFTLYPRLTATMAEHCYGEYYGTCA